MQEELSILELVMGASPVVMAVMAILIIASMVSWVMIFQRYFNLAMVLREATEFETEFWSGKDLGQIYMETVESERSIVGVESIFEAGFKEFSRLRQQAARDPAAVMQNVQRAMRVASSREEENLETNLPFLATVGSTSPYIGLFGTVWGIMNSCRRGSAQSCGGRAAYFGSVDRNCDRTVCRDPGSDCLQPILHADRGDR